MTGRSSAIVTSALAGALILGCGPSSNGSTSPSRPVGNPANTKRTFITGPTRPAVAESFPVDYASMPYLVTSSLSPAEASAGVSFVRTASGLEQPRVGNDLLAEIELGGVRAFTSEPLAEDASKPAAGATGCTPRPGTAPVSWEGFAIGSWSDDSIDYVRFEGTYDFETCRARPSRVARTRARALVPGLVYGFKTCVPVCTVAPATPGNEELLVVIGPPSRWVGATVPWPKMQTEPHVGLFTRLVVPLSRGGAASTFLHVSESDIGAFVGRRTNKGRALSLPHAQLLSIGFDFSWLSSDPGPVGVGFIGPVTGPTATIEYELADDVVEAQALIEPQ